MYPKLPRALITILAVIAGALFVISIYLERYQLQFLQNHPISVNLLSGAITGSTGFLIVAVGFNWIIDQARHGAERAAMRKLFRDARVPGAVLNAVATLLGRENDLFTWQVELSLGPTAWQAAINSLKKDSEKLHRFAATAEGRTQVAEVAVQIDSWLRGPVREALLAAHTTEAIEAVKLALYAAAALRDVAEEDRASPAVLVDAVIDLLQRAATVERRMEESLKTHISKGKENDS